MLYTSGTTGRPKGVFRKPAPAAARQGFAVVAECAGYRPGSDLHLCTGPLFHTAPLAFSLIMPLNLGCSVVLMDDWDSEHALALIEGYRITHTHMVPTMFHRLLGLPEEVRAARDLSSLRMVLHGAAPCPIAVKRAMIDWLGPVLHEYYAATEGWGSFVPAKEWLRKPGTVGKPDDGQIEIRDAEGKLQPPGTPDLVYLRSPAGAGFEYYKDSGKTSAVYSKEGDYFTLGDIGYLDEDGYLVLCARSADVIISGGVNIYPAEVEAILLEHPAVGDSATVGAPNEEWGEEVIAVVELVDGELPSEGLAQELIGHCRDRLASYKCPRRIDFVEALPRYETGKIYRRLVRDHYWEDREARI
jgi:long-chain acyl-CoA synthetase